MNAKMTYSMIAAALLLAMFSIGALMVASPAVAEEHNHEGAAASVSEGEAASVVEGEAASESSCNCPDGKCQCCDGKCACPECKCEDCKCAKGMDSKGDSKVDSKGKDKKCMMKK